MKAWRVLACMSVAVGFVVTGTASCGSDAEMAAPGSDDGGSNTDGPTNAEGGVSLDPATQAALAQDLAAARCDQAMTCAGRGLTTEGEHEHFPFRFYFNARKVSLATCNEQTSGRLRNTFMARIAAAIAAGKIAFHPEKMAACLAAIRMTCDTDTFMMPACREAFEGTTPQNGSCALDAACASGTVCEFTDVEQCGGRCVTPKKAAERCSYGSGCEEGLFCPPPGGVCTLRPKQGETCTQTTNGHLPPCTGFQYCVGPLQGTTCRPFSQIATKPVGTSCDDRIGVWCVAGLHCADQSTDPDAGPASGRSCRPEYAAGGGCDFSYPDLCPETHYCEETSPNGGTCNPRRATGATCTEQQACAAGTTCVGGHTGMTGVCLPIKDNGETCTSGQTCWSNECTKGKCTATHCG